MAANSTSYLDAAGAPLRIADTPVPTLSADEVLIRVAAVAINPVDWHQQDSGLFIKQFPVVLGNDVSGTIESVGSSVSHLRAGQRVLAHTSSLISGEHRHGAFQRLVAAKAEAVAPIPDAVAFDAAAVVPLGLSTAALGLYQPEQLGLRYPRAEGVERSGETLLVWGAASSVGANAVQLAVASGYDVVTTASAANVKFAEGLAEGVVCFDYKDGGVVEKLVAELKKRGKLVGAFDAVGREDSIKQVTTVLDAFGGGFVATVLPPPKDLPASVKVVQSK